VSQPSYEELAALVAEQARLLGERDAVIDELRARIAQLERVAGRSSSNSSQPSSKDSIAAKAQRRKDLSSRERSGERKPGGQKGRRGKRLEPAEKPDRTETLAAPARCSGCGSGLEGARVLAPSWAQVWDLLPVAVEKVGFVLGRRGCGCGLTSTACPPYGQAGAVVYGPNLNAVAILLGSGGNVPVERTASLMAQLFGIEVSTGFVARAHARMSERLERAGFDAAMKDALRAEEVLCGDESPVNVLRKDTDAFGRPLPGAPHAVTIRTPGARLVWYAPINARSSLQIKGLDVLSGWSGYLVRDDYAGWHQFDATLAGVQQCAAHLIRHCKGVLATAQSSEQYWAGQIIAVLREAAAAVGAARERAESSLDAADLAALRERYDQAVSRGVAANRQRDWPKGNHPGYNLATRLRDKAEQVWLFTRNFAVPWTNNASEQALRGPKRHQAVSGYWHTPTTLGAYCRVRSYLVSARNHGLTAIDAIHRALAANPWLPATT
jgi:transposase